MLYLVESEALGRKKGGERVLGDPEASGGLL